MSRPVPPTTSNNTLQRVKAHSVASKIAAAYPARLFLLVGYNAKASAQYIQLHNSATLPADTAVPEYSFKVDAASNFSLDLSLYGDYFDTGIVVCNSSTQATKTIGSADCTFTLLVL